MRVLVNGVGNIGLTVLNLLADYRQQLGISVIYAKKRTLTAWNVVDLKALSSKGIIICTDEQNRQTFTSQLPETVIYEEIRDSLDYVFETSANGIGNARKADYCQMKNLRGVCAQGSEKGFGIPFMSGVNEERICGEKFVQVVSCNTHASLSVLSCFGGARLGALVEGDFVVVRRSEDLENHQRLVSASVVARHLDNDIGTHHAIDAVDLLKTIGLYPKITSSDVTTPSQLLHAFRFNLSLKKAIAESDVLSTLHNNPMVAVTKKFDSNKVFEFGRKYGKYGRLYSQMIVVENNLMIQDNRIMGWAFIPQEGNTILSKLHAFLLQTQHSSAEDIIDFLRAELVIREV